MQYTRSSIAVCLLAKNCGEKLKNTLRQLEHVCSAFASVRFYIVENNSRDNTKAIIAAYGQTHPNMIADCFDDPSFEDLERIERLVLLRNRVLSLVKKDAFTPEYLLMADADVDIGNFNLGRILRKAPQDWVSVTANGRFYLSAGPFKLPVLYYDLFAYLPEEGGQTMLSENEMLNNRAPLHRKLRLQSYVRCRSAFGGMAVYRYGAVKNNAYTAEENTRPEPLPVSLSKCAGCRSVIRGILLLRNTPPAYPHPFKPGNDSRNKSIPTQAFIRKKAPLQKSSAFVFIED